MCKFRRKVCGGRKMSSKCEAGPAAPSSARYIYTPTLSEASVHTVFSRGLTLPTVHVSWWPPTHTHSVALFTNADCSYYLVKAAHYVSALFINWLHDCSTFRWLPYSMPTTQVKNISIQNVQCNVILVFKLSYTSTSAVFGWIILCCFILYITI